MSFSSYGFIKQVNDLHRKKVYKEKLRKLYGVEYSKNTPDKELKVIPEEKVEQTLQTLRSNRASKKRKQVVKNVLTLLLSILVMRSAYYLFIYFFSS